MSKKIIYFVRHGESELNAQGIRQGSEGSLSELGRRQAFETAKKFPKSKGKPQILFSSPYQRTKETAEIIAKELNMEIHFSDLLVERRNPSEIIGKKADSKEVKQIVDRIDNSFHEDNLRYSDEENFIDLKERARKLLHFIRKQDENRIIMVTHGIFLKMVIACMIYGKKLTASQYNELSYFNPINNAGMTICLCIPHWFTRTEWKLLTWNNTEPLE